MIDKLEVEKQLHKQNCAIVRNYELRKNWPNANEKQYLFSATDSQQVGSHVMTRCFDSSCQKKGNNYVRIVK